jgi:hypothetical protein
LRFVSPDQERAFSDIYDDPNRVATHLFGMRPGHFVADDHNNHYSLLRTIDDSLGLVPLTNNDEYARLTAKRPLSDEV